MTLKLSLEDKVNDGFTSELSNGWGGDDGGWGVASFSPPLLKIKPKKKEKGRKKKKKGKSYNLID